MNKFVKLAVATTIIGSCALAVASPSQAHYYRRGAALGFGAGANNYSYYGSRYYGSGYGSGYYGGAYAAAPYAYGSNRNTFLCTMSPASINYVPCDNWGGGP